MAQSYPHAAAANKYARDVVGGKIDACKWVKLACQRHLDELEASRDKTYPYYFDSVAAERFLTFAENLPHVKGKWARAQQLIHMEPWECFIGSCIFGWKRRKNDTRKYREVYAEICRKNGKSVLAAVIGLYMWSMDGEFGAEVYSGATTEKQAWEVFRPARLMVKNSPELVEATGAEVWARSLVILNDHSRFEPVIGNPGDGASPSCAIVDEFHEHDTPDLVETMQTGMAAREQPLLLIITTAGYNLAGPCFEKRRQAQQVLEGVLENDELFAIIYTIDDEDDWTDPKVLTKANPNFGVSVDADFLIAQQRQAVLNVSMQNAFKTKHLNLWCAARQGWIPIQKWIVAGDQMLTPDELIGCDCWFALDLASKVDLLAYMKIFRKELNGFPHYYVFGNFYLPEDTMLEPGKNQAAYQKWHTRGLLTVTDGATTDFALVTEQVIEDAKKYKPHEVVFDPFNATHPSQILMDAGLTVVEFQQRPTNFAVPMDEIKAALADNRFHHDGNEMLTWMMSNVTLRPAKKGLFYPTKASVDEKIDGPVAMIMGMSRAARREETEQEPQVFIL